MKLDLLLVMGLNRVEPKLVHKRCNNWVWNLNLEWWLGLEARQAVTVRRVAFAMSCSLTLVSVLVATESLGSVKLARTVKAWE